MRWPLSNPSVFVVSFKKPRLVFKFLCTVCEKKKKKSLLFEQKTQNYELNGTLWKVKDILQYGLKIDVNFLLA